MRNALLRTIVAAMNSRLNPYIHFKDNAREGMAFYKSVFGGNLTTMTFKDAGMAPTPAEGDLVMHSMLEVPNGMTLMGADTPSHMKPNPGATVTIALSGDNAAELGGYFDKLASGGNVAYPLAKAPWGDSFGMLTDRFGIEWMVNISAPKG